MNKYEQLDKELAEALGWTGVYIHHSGKLVGDIPNSDSEAVIPRWTQDDGECFRLMAEYGVWVKEWNHKSSEEVEAQYLAAGRFPSFYASYGDHPNKLAAFRFVAVQAVITKLRQQGNKEKE